MGLQQFLLLHRPTFKEWLLLEYYKVPGGVFAFYIGFPSEAKTILYTYIHIRLCVRTHVNRACE